MSSSFNRNTTGAEVVKTFSSQIADKHILITGPSPNSIGSETALSLAAAQPPPATLALLGRNEVKIAPVIERIKAINPSINTKFILCDLASQASIRKAAKEIINDGEIPQIDILINNAGVMALPTYQTTSENIEMQFGCNAIGHFLLTASLLPKILKAAEANGEARVVNVSSTGYELGGVRWEDWNFNEGKEYQEWLAYAQSKTGNVLLTAALAERFRRSGVVSFALQPGLVLESNLSGHVSPESWKTAMKTAFDSTGGRVTEMEKPKTLQEGCSTTLTAAFDPSISAQSGGFLQDCQLRPVKEEFASGKENADRFWALAERLVQEKFDF